MANNSLLSERQLLDLSCIEVNNEFSILVYPSFGGGVLDEIENFDRVDSYDWLKQYYCFKTPGEYISSYPRNFDTIGLFLIKGSYNLKYFIENHQVIFR